MRSSAPLLRILRSRSICSSSSDKIAVPKINPVSHPLQGSSFGWRQQCLRDCARGVLSKSIARCMSLGFGQQVRCLGSRASRLKNVHTSDGGMKNGSWTCPRCQSINSAQHQRCIGCLEPDSISISRSPTFGFSLGADSHNTRRVGLPQSIVKFCVLRSPHIDKKSREQFEMRIKKLYMVVKTRSEDLQKKFFWLKRQRILGAQYEIIFSYKTRLPLMPEEEK